MASDDLHRPYPFLHARLGRGQGASGGASVKDPLNKPPIGVIGGGLKAKGQVGRGFAALRASR
jgi:hypothetical protein